MHNSELSPLAANYLSKREELLQKKREVVEIENSIRAIKQSMEKYYRENSTIDSSLILCPPNLLVEFDDFNGKLLRVQPINMAAANTKKSLAPN